MIEKKSRNTMFALKPSTYENFKKIAHMQNITVNALANILLEKYNEEHLELVQSFDKNVVSFK